MHKHIPSQQRPHERGQTILLVALAMVSLLGMAALAIDVVTLYVARSEIQSAADAAALAGAKAVADSGFTTLPTTDTNYINGKALAQTMAATAVTAMVNTTATINLVAGTPATVVSDTLDFTTNPGSFKVTVSLKRPNLPTFFSKIWGRGSANVTATATAEAYNPSNLLTPITPMALRSLKPWLVANADPSTPALTAFVNRTSGLVEDGVIGKTFSLKVDCQLGILPCTLFTGHNPPTATYDATYPQVDYVPALVTDNNKNVCPICQAGSDFERSIACADANLYQVLSCGGGAATITWDKTVNPGGVGGDSEEGTECLINAPGGTGLGKGQDVLDASLWPTRPMLITASSGPFNGQHVTTSNSIVTIPIIDNIYPSNGFPISGNPLTVVGFVQAFINQIDPFSGIVGAPPEGSINVTVLNIAGCRNTANAANPVIGGAGTSPVPVRLITPP
jgi:Flp pilus assembly protein TadG